MQYPVEVDNVIKAAREVYNTLGVGYSEPLYQDALAVEFQLRNIPFEREKHLVATYKGIRLQHDYYADFMCYGNIAVECKAVAALLGVHASQVINYINMAGSPYGVLVNFGEDRFHYDRFVNKRLLMGNNSK